MLIALTSTKNRKNYENIGNSTTIDLGFCEKLLKEAYNI